VIHPRHPIDSSYYCQRAKQESLILVYNDDEHVMAEYSERTGALRYQRFVPAPQKNVIEGWLKEHFPVRDEMPKNLPMQA